ncbi:Squalene---hopene cyclase (EC @ Squalene---hopanol cyclase (EC [Olavius algarvensis associated proteobacterium Delta 3]|nr:Squalene---hopene cyclase (EC @ Squalene---hopanol cyclase (EC [Olavius algarvensis associated proteobacterium Delta 3]
MTAVPSAAPASRDETITAAIDAAIQWLEDHQSREGFWVGILESNVCIEAEWLLAFHFLGIEEDPKKEGLIRRLVNTQRPDGSWEIYFEATRGDINATVEAYAALRASGMPPDAEPLTRARAWILSHGGLRGVRVFTRYWLALIGEWPWKYTPNVPPEIIFFPRWFPFNIYNFASWARATILPLSILAARQPVRPLPASARLDELFPGGRHAFDYSLPQKGGPVSWRRFFLLADRFLHAYRNLGVTPGRELAVKTGLEWIVKHQEADGSWGGIQPPWIYSLMALKVEGYDLDHPVMRQGLGALDERWSYERDGGIGIEACQSPVWDTLLTLMALQDCDLDYHHSPAMQHAVEWMFQQQVKAPGDWQVKVPNARSGGWAFEFANIWYPDVDDTGVALIVLAHLRRVYPDQKRLEEAIELARDWVIAMQCKNGGWGAFDKDNDTALLTKIPFSDFGETLDPPSVDVTAHVVEAFGLLGMGLSHPANRRALDYMRAEQETDGSWFGRWGVNHIYGTAAVLPALASVGEDMSAGYVRKAADWIIAHQNLDGGWGETCASYMNPSLRGKGPSTASQTGWALMALLAVGSDTYRDAIEAGVDYLIAHQESGTWNEPYYTGTGFPGYGVGARVDLEESDAAGKFQQGTELSRGFMINYNLYRHYFPLMALGRARRYLAAAIDRNNES